MTPLEIENHLKSLEIGHVLNESDMKIIKASLDFFKENNRFRTIRERHLSRYTIFG